MFMAKGLSIVGSIHIKHLLLFQIFLFAIFAVDFLSANYKVEATDCLRHWKLLPNMGSSKNHSSSDDDDDEGSNDEGTSTQTRLGQQLQALKSLIPDMTETDERSILENTRDYLHSIHGETEQMEKEQSQNPSSSRNSSGHGPLILAVDTEEQTPGRFIVKIKWRKGSVGDGAGLVQRIIECTDVRLTSVVVNDENPQLVLTTAFVKVKKEMGTTEEELQDLIINAAKRSGLLP